ncbi:N-acetylmuramoyl-L-alanine amidase [Clostridium paraputrificum]|uniref:N-acetylmuramoyl-L-alanine amidase n=1 Tax=Clostridium paraputrificum TaxID=29363 RepID=UPI00040D7C30|nr:N-acetylmuramoyl-L-alanine amidase [Clostridium paraputrificum]
MIVGVDMGHTLSGAGTGANGFVSETVKNREVGKRLIQMLQEKGHKVINCTVDKSNNNLAERVAIANKQKLDFFISIHLNAYKTTNSDMGVETYTTSTSGGKAIAKRIQTELVNRIGWKNRGNKEADFYVIRKTIAPACLVELGFCDSKADMDKWNTEKIAAALFKGITGVEYIKPVVSNPSNDTYYRVCVGSYKNKENAINQQKKLKEKGFDSFLVAYQG